ncbi:hypothetical protein [Thermaerobacillus caldiproteolyticus]|nr:hypothetical protein [Anoxybacillus caldiproteolyticus]QPA30678.1 hypothetical protein ISX45_14020 [Anoxybacillus caldiproteolyticus]
MKSEQYSAAASCLATNQLDPKRQARLQVNSRRCVFRLAASLSIHAILA